MLRKPSDPLRSAFIYEVRPDVYLGRVWTTAILVAVVLAVLAAFKNGQFDVQNLMPLGGWQSRDPAGTLYVETWGTVIVQALQIGFGLWGFALILLGLYRIISEQKVIITSFTLGGAFLAFSLFLPAGMQIVMQLLVEHYPVLVQ